MPANADPYVGSDWIRVDIDRHRDALLSAQTQKKVYDYTGLWLAVSVCGKRFAKRIVTRGPVAASKGVWNIAERDKRVLDFLEWAGVVVVLLLWDEETGEFHQVYYKDWLGRASLEKGRGDQPDYYSAGV